MNVWCSLKRCNVWAGLAGLLLLSACADSGASPSAPAMPTGIPSTTPAPTASPTPAPDARGLAGAYLAAWQAGRYAEMHAQLAAESQAAWPAADFERQYRDLLELMTVTAFSTAVTAVSDAGDSAQVTATIRYETALVGALEADLTLPLRREAGLWRVVFSPALIWPELVEGRQLLMVPLPTERGRIFDRNGAPLVEQTDAYAIGLVPGELPAEGDTVPTTVGRLLGLAPGLAAGLYTSAVPDQYFPVTEISAVEFEQRYSFLRQIPGMYATAYNDRFYYGNGVAAHVTGYTTYIQPDELADYRARGYIGSERVGRAGLEAWAEPYLAGRAGGQLQLRDANNTFVRMVAATEPTPAQDVYATLDLDLQRAAQFALGDFPGAIVVLNRDTGEVLALVSTPTFSPNLFSPYNRNAVAVNQVLNDPRRPLLNHATQATYPAGSVFKVVTMAAGLTSGLFQPDTPYTCTGEWNEFGVTLRDWREGGHGELTFTEGLSASCNPWFYHVGYALFQWDPRWLPDTARAFGLGRRTQTQIDESPGQIPDPDWKQQTQGEAWSALDATNLSIGQGDVLVTPLQIARLAAAVGNGGALLEPQFVQAIQPADGGAPSYVFQPVISSTLPLSTTQLAAIQAGMLNVVQEPLGTARNRFRGFPICVAGKTGTAEDPGLFGEQDPDAWFMGYTCAGRADRPDIAVAVVVQNRGQGSDYAAPIFRRVLEAYFGLPYVRYPWESAVGVPAPEATPTPAPGAEPVTPAP